MIIYTGNFDKLKEFGFSETEDSYYKEEFIKEESKGRTLNYERHYLEISKYDRKVMIHIEVNGFKWLQVTILDTIYKLIKEDLIKVKGEP